MESIIERNRIITFALCSLTVISIVLILVENPFSVLSYLYTNILFFIVHFIVVKNSNLKNNFLVFQFYTLLAVLLYKVQLLLIPEWIGFSGGRGIGTDDIRFYSALTSNPFSLPESVIPYINFEHSFVNFLRILYPFPVSHPLDIIIPNILGISFIPCFCKRLYEGLFVDLKGGDIVFWFSLFCPILLSNGLVLIRDGWTAFLFVAGICFMVEKKFAALFLCFIILAYIRITSGLLMLVPLVVFGQLFDYKNYLTLTVKLIVLLIGIFVIANYYSELLVHLNEQGVRGFSREEYIDTFVLDIDSDSVIAKIAMLPLYCKIPVGFVFFWFLPYLTFQTHTENILNIRVILSSTIAPILFVIYYRYLFSGLIFAFLNKKDKHVNIIKVIAVYCIIIFLISQLSLQPRHKTMVMPLFYILAAHGVYYCNELSLKFGTLIAAGIFLVNVLFILN